MRVRRWFLVCSLGLAAACAAATTNVRAPLGAHLTPTATTGAPVPLRIDPNAKVILSSAAGLPAASFLPSQADRGQTVVEETCSTCHTPQQLVGQQFVDAWGDRRVYDLYALVRSTMPLDKPGGLTDEQYLDVVSYLLKANHAPSGSDSLRADTVALRSRRIAVRYP